MKSESFLPLFTLLLFLGNYSCSNSSNGKIPESFQIMEGYQLKLVAKEPLIKDPVDIEFDHNGDAFVLEMPGYPYEDQQSRIIKLIDENNDGIYDNHVIYAENLQLASSILPYKKGMLVAGPPYLLYVQDLDEDGLADTRDTLMGGFSTGNLQHNYNGLSYGLDNWIYAANGGNSGNPFWWADSLNSIDLRGDDFRINIEEKIIEKIGYSSGGFELAIDNYGRIFETHNLEHISHSVFPSRYINDIPLSIPHTLTNISDHDVNGLARIYPIGEQESRVNHPEQSGYFSGACGITHYGGGSLGQELDHSVWVCDVVLNLIHIDLISPKGATFNASRKGVQEDFLASSDRSFRPVNMTVGPDGAMYVVDMYREVIEHPEWIPDEIEVNLDLNAGKDKGRIYKVTQSKPSLDYDLNSDEGRIKALSHKNQWVRNTAHRLLAEERLHEKSIELLKNSLNSNNNFSRLHSQWLLHSQKKLTSSELLKSLENENSDYLENAILISENYFYSQNSFTTSESTQIVEKVIDLLLHKNQRVRMQAALSLSTMREDIFENVETKIVEAIASSAQMPNDQWNSASLAILANKFPLKAFEQLLAKESVDPALLENIVLGASRSYENLLKVLKSINSSSITSELKAQLISAAAEQKYEGENPSHLITEISNAEQNADITTLTALAQLRQSLNLPPSSVFVQKASSAFEIIKNQDITLSERLEHLDLIKLIPYQKKASLLYGLLSQKEPLEIQSKSLTQLWDSADPEIGNRLVSQWNTLGPQSRKRASDILLYKEAHHDALLTGLETGVINIGEMNFDLERRRTLLWWTDDKKTQSRAAALFSDSGVSNRSEVIEKMKDALSLDGNLDQGEQVFEQLCSQCHIYGNLGNDVGPNLTEINRKSKESLIHDILDPNAALDTRYINHRLETVDGKIVMGIVEQESDYAIVLKNSGGISTKVDKSDIKSFSSLGTSFMMEGLEQNMTHQDMADLLSFLQNTEL